MKKKVKLKNNIKSKKTKIKILFFLLSFIIITTITFNYLLSKNININNELLITYLLKNSNYEYNDNNKTLKKLKENISAVDLINFNYYSLKKYKAKKNNVKKEAKNTTTKELTQATNNNPLIYIYNSHQTEEYSLGDIAYNINPSVTINNYIMKDIFEKQGYKTLVEERSIKDILNLNSWNYASSYKASRIYMEDAKANNDSLKYFIDVHRDSLSHDRTSITIGDTKYAKVLFLIGLENPNYQKNLAFTERINNKIVERYNGLSKGIYQKEGAGVNGVYNQDFSENTVLIEIGGPENTIEEVMNTTVAISNIICEVIKENEI